MLGHFLGLVIVLDEVLLFRVVLAAQLDVQASLVRREKLLENQVDLLRSDYLQALNQSIFGIEGEVLVLNRIPLLRNLLAKVVLHLLKILNCRFLDCLDLLRCKSFLNNPIKEFINS